MRLAPVDNGLICAPDSPLALILRDVERIAPASAPVLVLGESGTGKEGVVQALHAFAPWRSKPLIALNCGAIPEHLLESELFGHVRGAFTGALKNRKGLIESVRGGTLFLDEIAELPLDLQVKFLRVLQEKVYSPVGSSEVRRADFRVVAATNADLQDAVSKGTFRKDLFYRLDVVSVYVPPLRERPMDLPLLAQHFLDKYRLAYNSKVTGFDASALALLESYTWPGNIRELENVVQSVLVRKAEGSVTAADIERKLGPAPTSDPAEVLPFPLPDEGFPLRERLERLERRIIEVYLRKSNGNKARTASLLGLKRTTLVEKLKRYSALRA